MATAQVGYNNEIYLNSGSDATGIYQSRSNPTDWLDSPNGSYIKNLKGLSFEQVCKLKGWTPKV